MRREQLTLALASDLKVASSFVDISNAEWAISKVTRSNAGRIKAWAQSSPGNFLILSEDLGRVVGYGVVRQTGKAVPLSKVRIVMKFERYNGMPYYILTSYVTK
ncbi:RNase A-like domain-containing protein [Trinickia mobilis]|uniref:RNase A-like domain-containing protein n=1 Tax=Trinickia mobilis TaxID=2816356 RepID=UPI002867C589|nr:RNase A-like domain-containing protein [Trinickia mobilis]